MLSGWSRRGWLGGYVFSVWVWGGRMCVCGCGRVREQLARLDGMPFRLLDIGFKDVVTKPYTKASMENALGEIARVRPTKSLVQVL